MGSARLGQNRGGHITGQDQKKRLGGRGAKMAAERSMPSLRQQVERSGSRKAQLLCWFSSPLPGRQHV